MKKIIFSLGLFLWLSSSFFLAAEETNTLLYHISFNKSLQPDIAPEEALVKKEGKDLSFIPGVNEQAVLLAGNEIEYTLNKIDPKEGSLQIWFNPVERDFFDSGDKSFTYLITFSFPDDRYLSLYKYQNGYLLFGLFNSKPKTVFLSGNRIDLTALDSLKKDSWHQIICTWKQGSTEETAGTLYLDGKKIFVIPVAGGFKEPVRLRIGAKGANVNMVAYDELKIFKKALAADEIRSLYEKEKISLKTPVQNQPKTVTLKRIIFLIHPNSFAALPPAERQKYSEYFEYEKKVEARWKEGIDKLNEEDFLVFTPLTSPLNPVGALGKYAEDKLGNRYLALGGDQSEWPGTLKTTLQERGFVLDPKTVRGEGWGESFDGCVAGYSTYLGTVLRFDSPVEVVFDMTVPDMPFLIGAKLIEKIRIPKKKLRLYLFEDNKKRPLGLFMPEVAGLVKPYTITVKSDPTKLLVYTKQGALVIPAENPDSLVRPVEGGIEISLRCDLPGGFYGGKREGPLFFVGKGTDHAEFRKILDGADIR